MYRLAAVHFIADRQRDRQTDGRTDRWHFDDCMAVRSAKKLRLKSV